MKPEIKTYLEQLKASKIERSHYGLILLSAALLAKGLGRPAVSAIEFGVAQGEGLSFLEKHATMIEDFTGVRIDLYGFDNGTGLPDPALDYRDAPHVWQKGMFKMDEEAVRARLTRSTLILGDVKDTVPEFLARTDIAPLGAIGFDLDYYSSTKAAFTIFDLPATYRLPRIFCYFDDMYGNSPFQAFNEHIGQLLAVREYNEEHQSCKLTDLPQLLYMRSLASILNLKIYVQHDFKHPDYTTYIPQEIYKPYF